MSFVEEKKKKMNACKIEFQSTKRCCRPLQPPTQHPETFSTNHCIPMDRLHNKCTQVYFQFAHLYFRDCGGGETIFFFFFFYGVSAYLHSSPCVGADCEENLKRELQGTMRCRSFKLQTNDPIFCVMGGDG